MARKALREGSWCFNEKDPTQSACLRSLGFAQPLESVGFQKYKAEACLGWLKTPKGEVLSDATRLHQGGGQPTTPKSEALAIVASPSCLRPKGNKEVAVSMGLVFISPYIEVVSFASTHIALKDWMEEDDEEEEEEEEPKGPQVPKVPFKWRLRKCRYKKFPEDTDEANYIKGILLGLGPGVILSQKQIDQSELFLERASDKTASVDDVSNAWMPILEDRLWLAVEAPDWMKHKDGTAPLYKFKDLLRLVPSAAGAWTAKNAKPALIAVIPPTTTTPLETAIGVEGLHTMAALRQVTIPKLPRDPGKKPKQYSFCGYCGVRIENFETDVNHIQHHLLLELLCGGCYGKAFVTSTQMTSHLKKCKAVLNILEQLKESKQRGSQNKKR